MQDAQCEQLQPPLKRLGLQERLTARKKMLELQLTDVTLALEALQRHPEVNEVLELVGRVGC